MNAPQPPPEDNSSAANRADPPSPRPPRRHIEIAKLLMPLAVLGVLIYLLRNVPDSVLRQEFEGLAAALCAITYAAILMWRLSRIIAPKVPPPDVPDPEETEPVTPDSGDSSASSIKSVNPGS